jgi:purine-cytosine permease-like protein
MTNSMTANPFDLPLQRPRGCWNARSARREEAQSLVELALLLPLFLLILLGSAEFARFAWSAVLTSNAARAGASFGARNPANAGNTAGIQGVAVADGVNLTGLSATPTPTVTCVCSSGAAIQRCITTALGVATSLTDCPSPATITNYVTVNTTSTVSIFGHSFTSTGQSTLVVAP